jgi:micrococcal nuclease
MRSALQSGRLGVLVLAAHLLCAADFTGAVVSVQDGDTLTVLRDGEAVRVRLNAIDCPEKNQPSGVQARQFTANLAFGTTVTVVGEDIDRYGRIVGFVILPDGKNLNHEIVAAGWAWWYRKYAPEDLSVRTLESEARRSRLGLWAYAAPIPPWEWRKQHHVPSRSDRRRSEPRSHRRDQRRSRR